MSELYQHVLFFLRSAVGNRILAITFAWVVFTVGTLGVMFQNDVYEASARVYVDVEYQLRRLLDDQIASSDLEDKLRFVRESLLSQMRLENVARNVGLIDESHSE